MEKTEISKKIYSFLTDFNIFYNKVKTDSIEINNIEKIKVNIDFLNNEFQTLEKKIALEFASKILDQLKYLKCIEEFVFEKADLIVTFFSIKENIKKLFEI